MPLPPAPTKRASLLASSKFSTTASADKHDKAAAKDHKTDDFRGKLDSSRRDISLDSYQKSSVKNLSVVIVYVLGVIALGWHLLHGFQSAFQTFGINHKKYTPIIKTIGFVFSLVICLVFAAMPVSIYAGWIN